MTRRPIFGIWWLHPTFVFGAAVPLIAIAACLIPESTYKIYWRTPKFAGLDSLEVAFACVAVFVFGAVLSAKYIGRAALHRDADPSEKISQGLTAALFRMSFYLCLLGYALWAGFAIQRGITWNAVTGVLVGEKGAMYDVRYSYLPTVGGVTTLAEFGIAAMILGAILGNYQGWRSVRVKLGILVALAVARALINSERFAVIELLVPFMVVSLALRNLGSAQIGRRARVLLNLAPLIGTGSLFLLFTLFEYFRSWTNYYADRSQSLWEFGAMRLLGYYVTAFNNGAYLLNRLDPLNAPYFTFHFLWNFPLSSPVIKRLFTDPILETTDKWFYFPFLESGANLEFNNADGVLLPLMDYGVAGGLIYWFIVGAACGLLYELYRRKEPLGLFLYPMIYLGLLEAPLALYWAEGRAFPSHCLLIGAPLLFWFLRRQFPARSRTLPAGKAAFGIS